MISNSSDQLFESLSALVDNEANELEVRRILKNIESNPELLERWRRYHLIGSALRREHSMQVSPAGDLAESIATYIQSAASDPVSGHIDASGKASGLVSASKGWKNILGKSAVAASFAATLVLGFNMSGQNRAESADVMVAAPKPAPEAVSNSALASFQNAPAGFELPAPEVRTVSTASGGMMAPIANFGQHQLNQMDDITDFATQQMLNELLIQHAERASAHGSLGIMPFARVSRMQSEVAR